MSTRLAKPIHYIAGAIFSNGIIWAVFFLLLYLRPSIDVKQFLNIHVVTSGISTVISGYLVAKKTSENHEKVGFTTGLVSLILYHIVIFFVRGVMETNFLVNISIVTGGVFGSAFEKINMESLE
jgi:hypothetical protein